MTTISDVAERAKVGVGTVSRVLNNSPSVSDRTREHVLAVIAELGYRPSSLARRLSLGRTQTIGIVAPFFTHPSVVERLRGIVETLRDHAYDLTLFTMDTPTQLIERLQSLIRPDRADGFLVLSLDLKEDVCERFRYEEIPVVLIDVAQSTLPHIGIDNVHGGFLATHHLLERGHQRIAFIGDSERNEFGFTSSHDRRLGYLHALQKAGIAPHMAYMKEGVHGREVAHRLTAELLSLSERPTAIFAASDTQALGVLEAAQQAGFAIPGDLSVIGFDDIEVAPYVGLTTVRQPLYSSGQRGALLLLDLLEQREFTTHAELLPLEVIVRRTTESLR